MIRYQLSTPMTISDITLITIERLSIEANSGELAYWLNAIKEPYALVIRNTEGVHALDMAGKPMAITELNELVTGLDQVLYGKLDSAT